MFPTYKDGDWLLVSWFPAGLTSSVGDRILGKVVVVEREERPGIFLVKRLQKSHGGHGFGDRILRRISRRATASPATGSHHLHEDEQKALLLEAFTR